MSGEGAQGGPDLRARLEAHLAGEYRFEGEIAGGGMSHVFLAEELRLKRMVVIKVLPPEMVPTSGAERFQREIELAAGLQHPHIVPVLTAGSADGLSYYTMPFVRGETLRERLRREGSIPADEAVRIWREVLEALAHAHANGVIHRDVKPGNILLSGRNALVTDFGIAHAVRSIGGEDEPPPTGPVLGTPAYMAPEQAEGEPVADPRIDVYQAGLVMYEMLTGHRPFSSLPGTGPVRTAEEEPRPFVETGVPEALRDEVLRCLAWSPEDRPPTIEAILGALDAGLPVQAGSLREGRTGRSRSGALYAAGVVALALTAWAVGAVRTPVASSSARVGAGVSTASGGTGTAAGGTPTTNLAAREWYERGMDVSLLRTESGRMRGIDYLQRAIALDSTYAAAHAGLSSLYLFMWFGSPVIDRPPWFERAEAAARAAIRADANAADGHVAVGRVRQAAGDYRGAEVALTRALAIDPLVPGGHEALARLYMMLGRPAEQLTEARLGLEAAPTSHSAIREMALALAMNDRCAEAIDLLRPLRSLTPPAAVAGVVGGQCYEALQRWQEAIAEYRWAEDVGSPTSALAFLGHALARAGRREEALDMLSTLLEGRADSHGAFGIATVYAGLGDHDQAFAWLERAVDDGTVNQYVFLPLFADLHRDGRFTRIREKMGLPTSPSRPLGR